MPLDWNEVRARYEGGAPLRPIAGSRAFTVIGVDDESVYVRSSLWIKSVSRVHLEQAVRLMEDGTMSRSWRVFVEEYGKHVTGQRRSLTANLLMDLGYLEE